MTKNRSISFALFVGAIAGVAAGQGWPVITTFAAPTGVCPVQGGGGRTEVVTFGFTNAAALGDVDGDGTIDIATTVALSITCPPPDLWGTSYRIYPPYQGVIRSGADGSVLRSLGAFTVVHAFFDIAYTSCQPIGDVNGDGLADVAMIAGDTMEIQAGLSGAVIARFAAGGGSLLYTKYVRGVGDVDADGADDFAIGVDYASTSSGTITLYSGRTQTVLRTFLGRYATRVGDLDGDGHADVLVADPHDPTTANGSATVFSGANGGVVHRFLGGTGLSFGSSISGVGDIDGDQVEDLMIGATSSGGSGGVFVYSGASGALIHSLTRPGPYVYGDFVHGLGDVDRDGVPDLLATSDRVGGPSHTSDVYSGATGQLLSSSGVTAVGTAGDFNGDGSADLLCTSGDRIEVRTIARPFGSATRHGVACRGVLPNSPQIDAIGMPTYGSLFSARLTSVPPNSSAVLHIGDPIRVALDSIGMTFGCTLYSAPFVTIPVSTSAAGIGYGNFRIDAQTAPVGAIMELQYAILAPGANALGVILSEALTLTIGP